ncbi:MAG: MlaC/ttg2D family ABC transporter substrate-binding protein [Pseudooceanicola sp.]
MPNKPGRRAFLAGGLALGLTAFLPRAVLALTADGARGLVDRAVREINAVIASGKSESAMIRDFETIFARYADVPIIARSCLGVDARRFSEAQIATYTRAFQGYISRKYGKRFREFIGSEIRIDGVRQVKTWHEVYGSVDLRNRAPFEVRFLVSDKSGRTLFFDIFIEGISMRLSERTEIGAMLDQARGDIGQLTAALNRAG